MRDIIPPICIWVNSGWGWMSTFPVSSPSLEGNISASGAPASKAAASSWACVRASKFKCLLLGESQGRSSSMRDNLFLLREHTRLTDVHQWVWESCRGSAIVQSFAIHIGRFLDLRRHSTAALQRSRIRRLRCLVRSLLARSRKPAATPSRRASRESAIASVRLRMPPLQYKLTNIRDAVFVGRMSPNPMLTASTY